MVKRHRETKAEQFRAKGSNILNDQPFGIGDFLNDLPPRRVNTDMHRRTILQIRKPTIPQMDTSTVVAKQGEKVGRSPNIGNETLGRLHLQIRQDLIEKLLDAVFERKRDPRFRGREATQRSVIEDALEHYFRTKGIPIECAKSKNGNMENE